EVEELAARLAATTERLDAVEAEFERFVYRASHDLQAPLRTVISFCELLETHCGDALDDTGQTYLDYAVGGAKHGQTLVRALLTFSRAGRETDGQCAPTDRVVQKVLATFADKAAACGARFTVDPLPDVDVPADLLAQVLGILVDNALNYRSEAPPHISLQRCSP
ncbi:MAG: light-regulated signal transduction histidine kinase (bacteriophytochrome), partial [Myxococcota bacterium]